MIHRGYLVFEGFYHRIIGKILKRIFDFFSVRSIFISPNEHQKLYFHSWQSHENTACGVHE